MDGSNWHHLADQPVSIDPTKPQQLRVRAVGDLIEVYVNDDEQPTLTVRDDDYPVGSVGVRVVNTNALFGELSVVPIRQ